MFCEFNEQSSTIDYVINVINVTIDYVIDKRDRDKMIYSFRSEIYATIQCATILPK